MPEQIFVNDVLFPVCLLSLAMFVVLLMFAVSQKGEAGEILRD